jgi:DNA polymerase-3 subunit delta
VTVRLLSGDDEVVLSEAVRAATAELVGDEDPGLTVDRIEGDDYEIGQAVDAARTAPFLTARRVVVVRHLGRFAADELTPLVDYLRDPLPTTGLVLVWEKAPNQQGRFGKPPKKLLEAVATAGGEVADTSIGTGRARRQWLDERLGASSVRFEKAARDAVAEHLGDDVDRVAAVVTTVEAAYGPGAKVGADEVAPFLGQAGEVPPWELTDAIDKGDIPGALDRLHRLLRAGDMYSLQVMGILTSHFRRILALEGADVTNEKEAAAFLGVKGSTFPVRKALSRVQRLGYEGAAEAMRLLAEADVDLRGTKAWPDELVLEVLVARLARLSR